MTLEQLKELCRHSLKGTAPENYSVGSVNEAIRDEFKTMCKKCANCESKLSHRIHRAMKKELQSK